MSQTEVWLYGADLEPRLNSYWLRYTTDIGIDCSRMFEQFEKRRSPPKPGGPRHWNCPVWSGYYIKWLNKESLSGWIGNLLGSRLGITLPLALVQTWLRHRNYQVFIFAFQNIFSNKPESLQSWRHKKTYYESRYFFLEHTEKGSTWILPRCSQLLHKYTNCQSTEISKTS